MALEATIALLPDWRAVMRPGEGANDVCTRSEDLIPGHVGRDGCGVSYLHVVDGAVSYVGVSIGNSGAPQGSH